MNTFRSALLFFLTLWVGAFGQTSDSYVPKIVPPSPQAASLTRYVDIPVSYYTGTANISIPIYTVQDGKITLPISISYHPSGIKVADEASQVGLGWALNAGGVISRTIMGEDDFTPSRYFSPADNLPANSFPRANMQLGQAIPNNQSAFNFDFYSQQSGPGPLALKVEDGTNNEYEPDIYNFNFAGYSGKFIITRTKEIIMNEKSDIRIKMLEANNGADISWEIKTPDGAIYLFNEKETFRYASGGSSVSSWYLSQITSPEGATISLSYNVLANAFNYPQGAITETKGEFILDPTCSTGEPQGPIASRTIGRIPPKYISTVYLNEITFQNGSVKFVFENRDDLSYDKKLKTIEIYNKPGGVKTLFKAFDFNYAYFDGTADVDYQATSDGSGSVSKRLKLLSLTEKSASGTSLRPHLFDYFEGDNYTNLPAKTSFAQDHWGYYNGKQGNLSLIPTFDVFNTSDEVRFHFGQMTGTERDTDPNYIKAFSLKKITYPTGGYTEFNYEAHEYDVNNSNKNDFSYSGNIGTLTERNERRMYLIRDKGTVQDFEVDFSKAATGAGGLTTNLKLDAFVRLSGATPCNEISGQTGRVYFELIHKETGLSVGTYDMFAMQECTDNFNGTPSPCIIKGCQNGMTGGVQHINTIYNIMPGKYIWRAKVSDDVAVSDFAIHFVWYEPLEATEGAMKTGGGLRIKTITSNDGVQSNVKTFNYRRTETAANGQSIEKSTGRLMTKPQYSYAEERSCTNDGPGGADGLIYRIVFRTSNSIVPLSASASGSVVGYDQVTVSYGANAENGQSIFYYDNQSDIVNNFSYYRPPLISSRPFKSNGNLLKQEDYAKSGTAFVKVKETEYDYELSTPTYQYAAEIRNIPYFVSGAYFSKKLHGFFYPAMIKNWNYLKSERTKVYDLANPNTPVETFKEYYYDNPNYTQLSQTKASDSRGRNIITAYKYPFDYNTGVYPGMVSKNMVSPVIEETTSIENGAALTWINTEYFTPSGTSLYVPKKVDKKIGQGSIVTLAEFMTYDDRGNLLTYKEKGGATTKLEYYGTTDAGKTDLLKSKTEADGTSAAATTTYNYKSLVGVESITEPSGKVTWYNYDNFGRLSDIREGSSAGNLIKSFHYNYANQGGFVNGIVDNPDVSAPSAPGLTSGSSSGNQCAANRVKLLWRNYNHDRLVGATIQGSSNGVDWVVLYQFPSAAPVGTWLTADFTNPQNYPHIRYNARATDGVGDLKEIRFFNVDGSGNEYALTGTGFGSEPNLAGQGWANALDGNETTQWHAEYVAPLGHAGNSNFVGISLPCATTLITPILYKSTSGDVCANGSPITLTASGFSGQLEWYLNDVLITGTQPGQTQYIATVAGTYKVRSKSGSSYSSFSNTIVLNQKAGCVPPNQCAANRVKLLWRNYNHDRLVGATIQGSSNGVDWIVLYQFPSAAPVGTWLTTDFNNPQNYPHIRYNARATDGVGDLKEIRFFNVDGSGNETALTGTGFGSEPNLAGQGWANALDGNETTQWHAEYVAPLGHAGNSNFVGITLPCATTLITPILYKSTSGDVCANGSPITLTASGFSGQLEWYLNDVLITGTQPGQTQYIATVAGTYKVRSKSGSSYSSFSNTIVLNPKAGCTLPNYSRVVIVGNSITKLVPQSGSDGWQSPALSAAGGWGRASSTQAKDFAHILEARFKQLDANAQVLPLWEAPFERDYISSPAGWVTYDYTALQNRIANSFGSSSWKPDLVIIRLGENVLNSEVELNNFKAAYNTLINKVLEVSAPGAKVIVTNSMWPDQPLANEKILQVATERGLPFVDLSDMISNPVYLAGNDPVSMAAFPNNTGDRHPGDAGMLEIAERIWAKVRNTDLPSNVGGNITKVRLSPRTQCCIERITGSVIQGSNDISNANGWTTLVEIKDTLVAGWNEYPIRTTTNWRYVRFLAGPKCYGELKELEFYNGNVKLTGTKFGSPQAYNNDPVNYGYAIAFDGLVTNSWHGTAPGPQNYAGLDLGASCATLTASVLSPANNASVVGTASTTTTGRVTTAISVSTCAPAGTTITSVEVWATTSTGGFPNRMGYAIADGSQPGVYKLSAEEGSANGKWPVPYLDPGTYRFYAKVNTASGTFTTDYITVTLTAPAVTGCPSLTASMLSPVNNASVVGTASTTTAGRVITALSVNTCVPTGTTVTSVEIWASTTSDTFHNLMGKAIADASQPGVYKLLAEEGSADGKWPAALLDPGTYRFYAKVKTASTTFTTSYITVTLTAPAVTGCPSLTGSMLSPANNASVVGTASTTTAGRVITALSVSTCVPTGTTITSVEIWASTTSDTFHNLMGKAIADASQPGVYKLLAEEGSADGKWPAALLDPGTYRFYAKVKTASTTFTTSYITVTLIAPPATGCPALTASMLSPANNASVVGTPSTTTAGRVITAVSVNTCVPAGSTITSVEIWATTSTGTFPNRMGYAVADASQPGVYKLAAEEGTANGKWPVAYLDPGTYRFYAIVKTATATVTTNYITVTLTSPATGCPTLTGSMLSPADNATVVGTPSTTTAGRVITALSVSTCVPAGSTITSVEIRATTTSGTFDNRMGYAIADASQPGVYKLAAEEGSANGKWPVAYLEPGTYRFYAIVKTATTTVTTNYITVTLTSPVTGCPTLTGSMLSPIDNATVVGTASTTTAGRVITALSVNTCVPTGTTITSVEIWASTTSDTFHNLMGKAIPDASQPGVYKLLAEEGSADGKWPAALLDPGTYRFYAKVKTASTTFTTSYITVTLTAPVTGCPSLTASILSPANNASVVGTASTTTAGRVITAISVTTCVPAGTTITSVEIWASTTSDTFHNMMGKAIPDASQPGVYKLSAQEGSADGKWPAALLDPGTYRFYAKVKTATTTVTTNYNTVTLTNP